MDKISPLYIGIGVVVLIIIAVVVPYSHEENPKRLAAESAEWRMP
jgi:hypothetical protein